MDDLDRLRFACDLAATPIDDDFVPLRWERRLRTFFDGAGSHVRGRPREFTGRKQKPLELADWRHLHEMAAALVDAATAGRKGRWAGVELHYVQQLVIDGSDVSLEIEFTISSTFARVLTAAVMAAGVDRFRMCQRCEQPFIRGRSDQRYCHVDACVRARQQEHIRRYFATAKGQRARRRQVDKLRRQIAKTRANEERATLPGHRRRGHPYR